MENSNAEKTRVLVVGDWIVDEHWIVGRHRSESASRTGPRHVRSLHETKCAVRSLSGAGLTATILNNAHCGPDKLYEVIGLGLWHSGDENAVLSLLDPQNAIGKTPFNLIMAPEPPPDSAYPHLHNLAWGTSGDNLATTRVIRIYEQKESRVELRDRIDWESRLKQELRNAIDKEVDRVVAEIAEPDKIEAILVKDGNKAAVSCEVIAKLAETCKNADWYISSKSWRPDWYRVLPSEKVKLVLVPHLAAQAAIRKHLATSSWITFGGSPSLEGMTAVTELARYFHNALVIVLPEKMQLLAYGPSRSEDAKDCEIGFIQTDAGTQPYLGLVPLASVFFPALITQLRIVHKNKYLDTALLKDSITAALDYTDSWMAHEYKRFLKAEWHPKPKQNLDIAHTYERRVGVVDKVFWKAALQHWLDARQDMGIVHYPKAIDKLQIWRGSTEINGYVACVPSKRRALRALVEHGRRFAGDNSQHMAFMIIDGPGSGKSYLVECLAKHLDMRFLKFDITQMSSRDDLLRCFDKIATTHAHEPHERMLVFIDEINAEIAGSHVYNAFLAPLEGGVYVHGGDTFHLPPCFWVFAGTREPIVKHQYDNGRSDDNKGSDFLSRMTCAPISLTLGEKNDMPDHTMLRIEKMYIAAATILRNFPDVRCVSRRLLQAIDRLRPSISAREMSQFIKQFRYVQYGIVTTANLPLNWERELHNEAEPAFSLNFDTRPEEDDVVILESRPGHTADL